ncbi:unnamed protein product, partial [Protopolystoma xenopodis]
MPQESCNDVTTDKGHNDPTSDTVSDNLDPSNTSTISFPSSEASNRSGPDGKRSGGERMIFLTPESSPPESLFSRTLSKWTMLHGLSTTSSQPTEDDALRSPSYGSESTKGANT